jgi:hypothetical protein
VRRCGRRLRVGERVRRSPRRCDGSPQMRSIEPRWRASARSWLSWRRTTHSGRGSRRDIPSAGAAQGAWARAAWRALCGRCPGRRVPRSKHCARLTDVVRRSAGELQATDSARGRADACPRRADDGSRPGALGALGWTPRRERAAGGRSGACAAVWALSGRLLRRAHPRGNTFISFFSASGLPFGRKRPRATSCNGSRRSPTTSIQSW